MYIQEIKKHTNQPVIWYAITLFIWISFHQLLRNKHLCPMVSAGFIANTDVREIGI